MLRILASMIFDLVSRASGCECVRVCIVASFVCVRMYVCLLVFVCLFCCVCVCVFALVCACLSVSVCVCLFKSYNEGCKLKFAILLKVFIYFQAYENADEHDPQCF